MSITNLSTFGASGVCFELSHPIIRLQGQTYYTVVLNKTNCHLLHLELRLYTMAFHGKRAITMRYEAEQLVCITKALGPAPAGMFAEGTVADISTVRHQHVLSEVELPASRECLSGVVAMALKCLQWDPASRPTAMQCFQEGAEAVKHHRVTGIRISAQQQSTSQGSCSRHGCTILGTSG
jgi:hypothetical protein